MAITWTHVPSWRTRFYANFRILCTNPLKAIIAFSTGMIAPQHPMEKVLYEQLTH